eukprot:356619-Chlamydomonas_euryale.AAC.2
MSSLRSCVASLQHKLLLQGEAKAADRKVRHAHSIVMAKELDKMLQALHKLKLIESNGIVTWKGQVILAWQTHLRHCALYTVSTLCAYKHNALPEMIFRGMFDDMNAQQLLAACSCFVCDGAPPAAMKLGEQLAAIFSSVESVAQRLNKTAHDVSADASTSMLKAQPCSWNGYAEECLLGNLLLKILTHLSGKHAGVYWACVSNPYGFGVALEQGLKNTRAFEDDIIVIFAMGACTGCIEMTSDVLRLTCLRAQGDIVTTMKRLDGLLQNIICTLQQDMHSCLAVSLAEARRSIQRDVLMNNT